ncbi:MAG: hypothetical protein Q4B04_00845 [bacterium]|nr:hypothetical protein [bacterium]
MISFNGFLENCLTFNVAAKINAGVPVCLSSSETVKPCIANDVIIGVVASGSDDAASVQMTGYVELPYTGQTAPTVGYVALKADGSGGVVVGGSRNYTVIKVDTVNKVCGFIL